MAPRNRSGRRSGSIRLGASATYVRDLTGAPYVSAYPARQGLDATTFADGLGPGLTPEQAGAIFSGVENGEEDIFSDQNPSAIAERWLICAALEREYAPFVRGLAAA